MEDENTQMRNKNLKQVFIVVVTIILTFLATSFGYYVKNGYLVNDGVVDSTTSGDYSKLDNIRGMIEKSYLWNIDEQKAQEGILKGFVNSLGDEYTEYITKEEWETLGTLIMGNFDGIGVYLKADETSDNIVVVSPMKDSPAHKEDIRPNDVIYKVEGTEYHAKDMDEVTAKLKGKAGTKVKVTIKRGEEILEKEVTRENIKLNHVETKTVGNNIGYIKLNSFDEDCATEFIKEYEKLKKEKNISSVIIDLRNNPGGIFDESLKIADYFLPKCDIVYKINKKEEKKTYTSDEHQEQVKIVVLVNENSASAAEILSGALKDNHAATIVGTKTFGKGLIQELYTLKDGSVLKVTVAEYYMPSGTKINKVGVIPDVEVQAKEEYKDKIEVPENQDLQLQKAIESLSK